MPCLSDAEYKSEAFKGVVKAAHDYARANDLDPWATSISWVSLVLSPLAARRFAGRRPDYRQSQAWACYTRLQQAGLLDEAEDRLLYVPTPRWDMYPMAWFDRVVAVAAGHAQTLD